MSSALDTIIRKDVIKILENIIPKDEVRMPHPLLSNTSLDTKVKGAETESLQSNKGLSQGDSLSGIFFKHIPGRQSLTSTL